MRPTASSDRQRIHVVVAERRLYAGHIFCATISGADDDRRHDRAHTGTSAVRALYGGRGGTRSIEHPEPVPFHLIHVDSSWGAGLYGKDHGGFRRDTWIFDEGSHTWGYFESATKTFATSKIGPHDEPYTGAFRPRIAS